MDKTEVLNIAEAFARKVTEKYDCISVVLFGSYAKGTQNADSDIDIAVILKDYDNLLDIQLELMRLRRSIDSRIEPHPLREHEFNQNLPLVNEIKKFGKKLNIA